jgi:hypothetical protein
MPQFWQYACCTLWLPSHDIFQQWYFSGRDLAAEMERGDARRKRMALAIGLLCDGQGDVLQ